MLDEHRIILQINKTLVPIFVNGCGLFDGIAICGRIIVHCFTLEGNRSLVGVSV
jgi:hypothetical protein